MQQEKENIAPDIEQLKADQRNFLSQLESPRLLLFKVGVY